MELIIPLNKADYSPDDDVSVQIKSYLNFRKIEKNPHNKFNLIHGNVKVIF